MKLIIGNSYSKIEGFNHEQFQALRKLLSYEIPKSQQFYTGGRFGNKRYLIDKKGNFPSGLVNKVLPYVTEIVDLRKQPIKPIEGIKAKFEYRPYDEQIEAAKAICVHKRGIIRASTGLGKSLIGGLIVNALKLKTLIVVPNLTLKYQLIESMSKWFGSLDHITIENIDSPKLEKEGEYDLLIIDEAHHASAKTYRHLNKKYWHNIYYRVFLTATPYRTNSEENMLLQSICGEVIYDIPYKTAVEKGYIVPIEAYYYALPPAIAKGYTWSQVYSDRIVKNSLRNKMIAELALNLNSTGVPTLVLVKEIAHGKKLSEMTGLPFVSGQDEESKRYILDFNAGRIKCLIGTRGVLGEGVDSRPAEFIILADSGKARGAFMQACGRGFRRHGNKESCKIILFKDNSHKWLKAHFAAQLKILKEEYGIKAVKFTR